MLQDDDEMLLGSYPSSLFCVPKRRENDVSLPSHTLYRLYGTELTVARVSGCLVSSWFLELCNFSSYIRLFNPPQTGVQGRFMCFSWSRFIKIIPTCRRPYSSWDIVVREKEASLPGWSQFIDTHHTMDVARGSYEAHRLTIFKYGIHGVSSDTSSLSVSTSICTETTGGDGMPTLSQP